MLISEKERAYKVLRQRLEFGDYSAGTKVSDYVVAKEIGTSRSPVREAISQLASEGLFAQIPHYGTFVRKLTAKEFVEAYQVREALESYAVWVAAQDPSPQLIQDLESYCAEMRSLVVELRSSDRDDDAGDFDARWVQSDLEFHMAILRSVENEYVMQMVSNMRLLTRACGGEQVDKLTTRSFVGAVLTWKVHMRILRSIKRRDAESARYWMQTHIQGGLDARLERLDEHHDADLASQAKKRDDLIREIERYPR